MPHASNQSASRPPESAVARYRKILRKLEPSAGCPPEEQATAQRLLASMEQKYPGIQEWARLPEVDLPFGNVPPPSPGMAFDPGGPYMSPAGSPLHRLWEAAQSVWNTVSLRKAVDDVAQHFTQVKVASTHDGSIRLTVTIQSAGLDVLDRVAPEASYDFAESVASIVHGELLSVLDDG